jgi:hypothetical protein
MVFLGFGSIGWLPSQRCVVGLEERKVMARSESVAVDAVLLVDKQSGRMNELP